MVANRDVIVVTQTGEESTRPMNALLRLQTESLTPVNDMVTMGDLNEPSVLNNLRARFNSGVIYTAIGSILGIYSANLI